MFASDNGRGGNSTSQGDATGNVNNHAANADGKRDDSNMAEMLPTDDFGRLASANQTLVEALLADENAPDADLYRRLLMNPAGGGSHLYRPARGDVSDWMEFASNMNASTANQYFTKEKPAAAGSSRGHAATSGSSSSSSQRRSSPLRFGSRATGATASGTSHEEGGETSLERTRTTSGGGLFGSRSRSPRTLQQSPGSPSNERGGPHTASSPSSIPTDTMLPTSSLSHTSSIPMPAFLSQQISTKAKISSLMGLLPEASLAWMSVDYTLYLWRYGQTGTTNSMLSTGLDDFCSFRVPSKQCVSTVGLAKPKSGIFNNAVKWVVVVTTPEEILLCAFVEKEDATAADGFGEHGTLQLVATSFVIPTDGVSMYAVASTRDGRIFVGGANGSLYEVSYDYNIPDSSSFGSEDLDYEDDASDEENEASWTSTLISGSKRLLSDFLWKSSAAPKTKRRKTCTKVNLNQQSFMATILPSFLQRLVLTGTSGSTTGDTSPILDMVVDESRGVLHTLSAMGALSTFALNDPSADTKTKVPVVLSSLTSINLVNTSKSYLESLSRHVMYSSSKDYIFAGGAASALSGLGGQGACSSSRSPSTESARTLLKLALDSSPGPSNDPLKRHSSDLQGILVPSRCFVVPPSTSESIYLVVVTQAGLRFYLSLPDNSGGILSGSNSFKTMSHIWSRRQLCHIRCPPPSVNLFLPPHTLTEFPTSERHQQYLCDEEGVAPGILKIDNKPLFSSFANGSFRRGDSEDGSTVSGSSPFVHVVASYFDTNDEILLLGLNGNDIVPSFSEIAGTASDGLLATLPDLAFRKVEVQDNLMNSSIGGSGVGVISPSISMPVQALSSVNTKKSAGFNEIVSCPLPKSIPSVMRDHSGKRFNPECALLPGGKICHIAGTSYQTNSKLWVLANHSVTPALKSPEWIRSLVNLPSCSSVVARREASIGSKYQMAPLGEWRRGFLLKDHPLLRSKSCSEFVGSFNFSKAIPLSPFVNQFHKFLFENTVSSKQIPKSQIFVLNSGGIHILRPVTILELFASLLTILPFPDSPTSVRKSPAGRTFLKFITAYGQDEVCAMSLAVAIATSSSVELMERGRKMALTFGGRPGYRAPGMASQITASEALLISPLQSECISDSCSSTERSGSITSFHSSSLQKGLIKLLGRLLRPVWLKPLVVVVSPDLLKRATQKTHKARKGVKKLPKPSIVEFLLDCNTTFEQVYRPLKSLEKVMLELFRHSIETVPGSSPAESGTEAMNVDETMLEPAAPHLGYLSYTMVSSDHHRRQLALRGDNIGMAGPPTDMNATARFLEESSIHNIYRLLSRTTQLLALWKLLHQLGQRNSVGLGEVEWGLLHNLTVYQLVCSPDAADRLTVLLQTMLLSLNKYSTGLRGRRNIDLNCDYSLQIARQLSQECYLFFSEADFLAQKALSANSSAIAEIPGSLKYASFCTDAGDLWKRAAICWRSSKVVTGQVLQANAFGTQLPCEFEFPEETEELAFGSVYSTSPLVTACVSLYGIPNLPAIVEVCLVCASNFRCSNDVQREKNLATHSHAMWEWENDLYYNDLLSRGYDRQVPDVADGNDTVGQTNPLIHVAERESIANDVRKFCYSLVIHFLRLLFRGGDSAFVNGSGHSISTCRQLAAEMLLVCASSSDYEFHSLLYTSLVENNYSSFLLSLKTPYLEEWLGSYKAKDCGFSSGVDLLYSYFIFNDKHGRACNLMIQRARAKDNTITLGERINCLTKAISSAKSSSDMNNPHDIVVSSAEIRGLNDTLEIAILQSRVLSSVQTGDSPLILDADQLHSLGHELLSVSDLFNTFAAPLQQYENCLSIMNVCKNNDAGIIETLWTRIIARELHVWTPDQHIKKLLASLEASPSIDERGEQFIDGEWALRLSNKITSIGLELWGKGADYTFPLSFIIPTCEIFRAAFIDITSNGRNGSSAVHPWVALALSKAGVSFHDILHTYSVLFAELKQEGSTKDKVYYMRCIAEVLTLWINNAYALRQSNPVVGGLSSMEAPKSASAMLSQAIASGLLTEIDSYKSYLESIVGGDTKEIQRILILFITIEESIHRF